MKAAALLPLRWQSGPCSTNRIHRDPKSPLFCASAKLSGSARRHSPFASRSFEVCNFLTRCPCRLHPFVCAIRDGGHRPLHVPEGPAGPLSAPRRHSATLRRHDAAILPASGHQSRNWAFEVRHSRRGLSFLHRRPACVGISWRGGLSVTASWSSCRSGASLVTCGAVASRSRL